jgi:Icc protein
MHHPPLVTGVPAWDRLGLAASDRQALGELIGRHEQVSRLACGHFHRTMSGELAGRSVLVTLSTYVQMRPNFLSDELDLTAEPAGFAVHAVVDGELVSHVQSVH